MTDTAKGTVLKLLADVGKVCAEYQNEVMKDLPYKKIQCDEIWSFCYAKEKNVPKDKEGMFGYGDVYKTSSKTVATLHAPHVRKIKRLLKRIVGRNPRIHRAWSAAFALSKRPLPYISVSKGVVEGAGTQIAAIAVASYFSSALLHKKHPLARVFHQR